jgi:ribosomal protein L37E
VTRANGKEREAHIHQELRLRFKRRKGVLSKEPEALRTLGCPSCGSPTKLDRENLCAHCGQAVEPGQFHWELFERQPRSLSTVEATRPRLGGWKGEIRFAYLYDAAIREAWRSFSMRNPGETLERLLRRARQIFCAVQDAWAGGDVAPLRGLLTDRLFQVHLFWHDWLEASRYRVELERVEVQESELVRLWRDAFYDIATVKLVGERVESVRDASGKMIFGSTSKAQPFCEYLTFVRRTRAGAKALRATRCPACGAPAPARMAEVCGFCGASLFAGEFDWTLAGIELGRLRK